VEPALEEILSDPIVRLVMRRDRIARADVLAAVYAARARLGLSAAQAEAVPG
jgi:hypothetical protein